MAYQSQRIDLRNRIELLGAAEVQAALLELSARGAKAAGRNALRKVARTILAAAKDNVPTGENRLRRALNVRVDRGRDRNDLLLAMVYVSGSRFGYRPRKTQRKSRVKGKLGPARYAYQIGSKPNVYGAFLEFGAPAHGIAPQGWMRRAWEQAGGERAVQAFADEIGPAIMAAAAKYGFRTR